MVFQTAQILILAALLFSNSATVQANDMEARKTKSSKNTKNPKGTKSMPPPAVTCPTDKQHAAAIGNRMWADMWFQMVNSGCTLEGIQDVWTRHLEANVTCEILQPAFGVGIDLPGPSLLACSGAEDCVNFFPTGTLPNCQNKNFLSFSAHSAEINEDDCMEFTVFFNEYITTPQNCGVPFQFATGRTYTFRMNENYVEGGNEPMARLKYVRFNCPFQVHDTLVDCVAGGIDARIDPNYTIFDETPDLPGCIAGVQP